MYHLMYTERAGEDERLETGRLGTGAAVAVDGTSQRQPRPFFDTTPLCVYVVYVVSAPQTHATETPCFLSSAMKKQRPRPPFRVCVCDVAVHRCISHPIGTNGRPGGDEPCYWDGSISSFLPSFPPACHVGIRRTCYFITSHQLSQRASCFPRQPV